MKIQETPQYVKDKTFLGKILYYMQTPIGMELSDLRHEMALHKHKIKKPKKPKK